MVWIKMNAKSTTQGWEIFSAPLQIPHPHTPQATACSLQAEQPPSSLAVCRFTSHLHPQHVLLLRVLLPELQDREDHPPHLQLLPALLHLLLQPLLHLLLQPLQLPQVLHPLLLPLILHLQLWVLLLLNLAWPGSSRWCDQECWAPPAAAEGSTNNGQLGCFLESLSTSILFAFSPSSCVPQLWALLIVSCI